MNNIQLQLAKIKGLKKSFELLKYPISNWCKGIYVEPLFEIYLSQINLIKNLMPELYSDLPEIPLPRPLLQEHYGKTYNFDGIHPLINNLDYILELYFNYQKNIKETKGEREFIFISHGKSQAWYKMQAFLEKDHNYKTIELEQQSNLGRTILIKLDEVSNKCNVAIIVMTGDDKTTKGETRARQNVIHEIGFFQGKLGLSKVIILHEKGVELFSNIHGLVYIPFPKGTIEAAFGNLLRELKIIID